MKISTVPVKTYITPSKIPGAGYVINPYIGCPHKCLYCYAQFMRKFTAHSEPWGDFLDVKLCAVPLRPAQLFHQHVLLSSVTDCYNPFEQKYQITRRVLEQLVRCQAHVSILTKSSLVTRDIDLLKQLPACEVAFSFSTVDEPLRRLLEPCAASVEERLSALKTVHDAGLPTAVMAAPLLPGLSDFKTMVTRCAPFTQNFRFDSLNMYTAFQHKLMDFIDVHYPHLLPLYNQIYLQGKRDYWQQLKKEILNFCTTQKVKAEIFFGKKSSFTFRPLRPHKEFLTTQTLFPEDEPQLF